MKTTIQDILKKLSDIDNAISMLENMLPKDCFRGQEHLCDAIDLLSEYKDKILDSKVDI
jgi:hypothetical protein